MDKICEDCKTILTCVFTGAKIKLKHIHSCDLFQCKKCYKYFAFGINPKPATIQDYEPDVAIIGVYNLAHHEHGRYQYLVKTNIVLLAGAKKYLRIKD